MDLKETKNKGASEDAIQHHYDVGNTFYSHFLDKKMVYSCALWEDEDDTLEEAQIRKLEYHLNESESRGKGKILDIGCGWGALLELAKTKYGVGTSVGLTLSKEQEHYINKLNVPDTEVYLESWENHFPEFTYDSIISIGAFEHFARPELSKNEKIERYRYFFKRCHELLKPGGKVSLQTITYDNMARKSMSTFIAKEIFPESDLPKLNELIEATDGLFSVVRLRNDAYHYKLTCSKWLSNLRRNRSQIESLVGLEKYQTYNQYLTMVIMGFHTQNMGLVRVTLSRLDKPYRT